MSEVSDALKDSKPAKSWFSKLCFWRSSDHDVDSNNVGVVVFLAAVIVIALLGYFTSRAALSVEMVNARLAVWGDLMKESAARKGYDASFTHGAISIEGGLFSKRAVIADPHITLSRNNVLEKSFGTSVVEIQPETSEMEKLRVVFPAPLKIKFEGEDVRRFELGTPLEVDVVRTENGQAYESFIPTQINVFKDKEDTADAIPYMTFETQLGAKVTGFIGFDSEEYTQHINLLPTTIKTADRTTKIVSLNIKAEAAKEDAARMTHYEIKVGKLETTGILSVLSPLDIEADIDRETASVMSEDDSENHKDYSYFFNALSVYSGNSALKLTGKFDVVKDEILPMGSAEVSLSQVGTLINRLKTAGILDDRSVDVSRTILKRIASQWNTKTDTIQFTLEREFGGGFFIGDVTFEELLATALKQYLLGVTQPEPKIEDEDAGENSLPDADIISNGGLEHESPAKAVGTQEHSKTKDVIESDDTMAAPSDDANVKHEDAKPEATTEKKEPQSLLDKLFSNEPAHSSDASQQLEGNGDSPSAMESLEDTDAPAGDSHQNDDKASH